MNSETLGERCWPRSCFDGGRSAGRDLGHSVIEAKSNIQLKEEINRKAQLRSATPIRGPRSRRATRSLGSSPS